MSGATLAQRRKHYRTWAAKPGALEGKARVTRDEYRTLRSLGLCVRCRNADALPGLSMCQPCRTIYNEREVLRTNMKRFWASRYSPGFEPALPYRMEAAA